MHVRIAWEIYHHQAKQNPDKTATPGIGVKSDMLRPPTHIFPPGGVPRSHEISSFPPTGLPGRPPYESGPMPGSFLGAPGGHLGKLFRTIVNNLSKPQSMNCLLQCHLIF